MFSSSEAGQEANTCIIANYIPDNYQLISGDE